MRFCSAQFSLLLCSLVAVACAGTSATDAIDDGPITDRPADSSTGVDAGASEPRATEATTAAVGRGLDWLASQQDPKSGMWRAPTVSEEPAVTGLALLAFLSGGYTSKGPIEKNPYADNVRVGLRGLVARQLGDGSFGKRVRVSAVATLALVEAYWMTRDPHLKQPAAEALHYLALARYPSGAWGDGTRQGTQNTVDTVWSMAAAKSGKYAGFDVDPDMFHGARGLIEKMTDEASGRAGYDTLGGGVHRSPAMLERFPRDRSRGMTAALVYSRVLLGEDPATSELIKKGVAECASRPPRWNTEDGSIDMQYWYFGSLAMFQIGGRDWSDWNKAMTKAILAGQVEVGEEDSGSWPPLGPCCDAGGRVYATALMTMCLEVYFRYDRVFPR